MLPRFNSIYTKENDEMNSQVGLLHRVATADYFQIMKYLLIMYQIYYVQPTVLKMKLITIYTLRIKYVTKHVVTTRKHLFYRY